MSGHPDDSPRQSTRFRLGIQAELRIEGRAFPCDVQNISRTGALLAGDLPAAPAETVELIIKAPTGQMSVQISGEVVRTEPTPDGSDLHVAIRFVGMDDARRDEVEVLLARFMEAPSPSSSLESLKPGAAPPEIKKALEAIPIAKRIALSARAGPKEREYLRMDGSPAVLEALARNPGLTIVEARALAASTYLMPGTLDALANDPRFRTDDELRMAIAAHPKVSLATAERMTADLKPPQIKVLVTKPGLNPILREKLLKRTRR